MKRFSYKVEDYPYVGVFYEVVEDLSKPLNEREPEEVIVLETECDIQEVSKATNPALLATFSIFFPFDVSDELIVRRGMGFRSSMNGMEINGQVTNVVVSRIGGCVAYVKDYETD